VGVDPGSKADKAKQLGVETLDEAAFRKLIT
jgi:NAD-dependent DNA ligase